MVGFSDNIPCRIATLYQAFYEIMDITVRMQSWNLWFVEVTRHIKTKFQSPGIKTQIFFFFEGELYLTPTLELLHMIGSLVFF